MVDEPRALDRVAIMDSLSEGIEHKTCLGRGTDPPAADPPGIGVDDESHGGKAPRWRHE